ncbi:hypothetical protein EC988_008803 [Linderina pennispora]|nr:hypothetical protein EC988_008803 [Linderina pennispora]
MVQGDTATENCRLDGPYTPGALLNGYRFYVWGELDLGPAYPNADALKLIRAAGGDIVAHCPAAQPGEHGEPGPLVVAESCKPAIKAIRRPDHRRLFAIPVSRALPTILIDNKHLASARKAAEVLDSLIEATGGGLACRPKSWLLDCISANELV